MLNDLDLPRRADWSPEGEFVECSIVPQLKVRILNLDWIDDFPILFAVDVVKQVGYCVMDDVVVLLDRYDAFVVAELDLFGLSKKVLESLIWGKAISDRPFG